MTDEPKGYDPATCDPYESHTGVVADRINFFDARGDLPAALSFAIYKRVPMWDRDKRQWTTTKLYYRVKLTGEDAERARPYVVENQMVTVIGWAKPAKVPSRENKDEMIVSPSAVEIYRPQFVFDGEAEVAEPTPPPAPRPLRRTGTTGGRPSHADWEG